MTSYEQIQEKITALESALVSANPLMPNLLRQIHTQLKNDPAIVTLLTESEIAVIVSGLSAQTSIQITTAKPTAAAKKALTRVTTDELGF
jgi:hypothetical protein